MERGAREVSIFSLGLRMLFRRGCVCPVFPGSVSLGQLDAWPDWAAESLPFAASIGFSEDGPATSSSSACVALLLSATAARMSCMPLEDAENKHVSFNRIPVDSDSLDPLLVKPCLCADIVLLRMC